MPLSQLLQASSWNLRVSVIKETTILLCIAQFNSKVAFIFGEKVGSLEGHFIEGKGRDLNLINLSFIRRRKRKGFCTPILVQWTC